MSMPTYPSVPDMTRESVINQIIASIAMEELSLSHILNAEGEKLQYVLGTLTGSSGLNPSIDDLLKVNESVHGTLSASMQNQMFLHNKMSDALAASSTSEPTPGNLSFNVVGGTGTIGNHDPVPVLAGNNLIFTTTTPDALAISVSPGTATINIDAIAPTNTYSFAARRAGASGDPRNDLGDTSPEGTLIDLPDYQFFAKITVDSSKKYFTVPEEGIYQISYLLNMQSASAVLYSAITVNDVIWTPSIASAGNSTSFSSSFIMPLSANSKLALGAFDDVNAFGTYLVADSVQTLTILRIA